VFDNMYPEKNDCYSNNNRCGGVGTPLYGYMDFWPVWGERGYQYGGHFRLLHPILELSMFLEEAMVPNKSI